MEKRQLSVSLGSYLSTKCSHSHLMLMVSTIISSLTFSSWAWGAFWWSCRSNAIRHSWPSPSLLYHCRQSSTTNTIHSRKWCILSLPCHPWRTCPTKVEQWTWKYSRHFIQSKRLLCKDCNAWPSTAWSKLDIWTQRAAEAFKDIR